MIRNWLLDFDDTLASGPTTWGLRFALPKLVREQALPFDEARFAPAVLDAQARVAQDPNLQPILDDLFDSQGWPRSLQALLMTDMQKNYAAELFEDASAFLQRLSQAGHSAYIVSNNPRTPDNIVRLGIAPYVARAFTPANSPGTRPKPHPSLWEYVLANVPGLTIGNTALVGDDPWSDAAFAQATGLRFWIVDRDHRFGELKLADVPWRVESLLDIPLPSAE